MSKRKAYLLFLLATVIWGFAFVAQKAATILPPFTVCAMRALIAAVFLIAIIPIADRLTKNGRKIIKDKRIDINRRELVGGAILGVVLTASSVLQQAGLSDTDAGKAAFITTLYVVFVPLVSAILGKKPGLTVIVSVPISVIGFYFLCIKPGVGIELSDLMVLSCALVFSFHIIGVDRLSPGCDGIRLSLIQFVVSFILNAAIGLVLEGVPSPDAMSFALPSLLFLGVGSSGIAYTLQIIGQKHADPNVSSLILSLESVFAVIGAAMVLGERMSGREYLGCAIVLIAVLIAQLEPEFVAKFIKIGDKSKQ